MSRRYTEGEAGRLAAERYASGANCAESVLYAVPLALGDETLHLPEAAGMGWTAGIGEQGCLCGALAAAVVLAGMEAEQDGGLVGVRRERAVARAAEMERAFKDRFGATCCRVLRKGLEIGTPECKAHCREMTSETAEIVARLLSSGVPAMRSATAGDVLRIGIRALGWAAVGALVVLAVPGVLAVRSLGEPVVIALVLAALTGGILGGLRAAGRR